eukprot:CAMPEP_0171955932 /NCGR_PEP_ID=MMETSP0993-20121228/117562_1 /TAXON_ID=483369 /ORGANISM="non described non described, Strain CCMP2098" /LENGTH=67 /DNA_ID=CAMNT_0012602365 /DNA_START=267 /DNA_END=470 /DNA_ORIENTATION=-
MSSWEIEQTKSSEMEPARMEETVVLDRLSCAIYSSRLLEDEDGKSTAKALLAAHSPRSSALAAMTEM